VLAFSARILAFSANDIWTYSYNQSVDGGHDNVRLERTLTFGGGGVKFEYRNIESLPDSSWPNSLYDSKLLHRASLPTAIDLESDFSWYRHMFRNNGVTGVVTGVGWGDFGYFAWNGSIQTAAHGFSIAAPLWLIMAISAVLPAIWEYKHRALFYRRQRGKRGMCVNCGYDLRATPKMCPECGTVVRSS
jgi:hypothetical protein